MADNKLYWPLLNPVKMYETTRAAVDKYFTKHFDYWMFEERLYDWQTPEEYCQIWQTTDIILLQFPAMFDPIIIKLVDKYGNPVAGATLPALIGMPNIFIPGAWIFKVEMSLGPLNLASGCYRLMAELGPAGDFQKILISNCMYISNTPIPNTILTEYRNRTYHGDIVWEDMPGKYMQVRYFGSLGLLDPLRKDEFNRDQRYNPNLLSSKVSRGWPLKYGDEFGLPDDAIDHLNRVWSCNDVMVDGLPMGITDGGKFELEEIEKGQYPKRGVTLNVEEGINRHSRIFTLETDPNKKMSGVVLVDVRAFADLANQGSTNAVPVFNQEIE